MTVGNVAQSAKTDFFYSAHVPIAVGSIPSTFITTQNKLNYSLQNLLVPLATLINYLSTNFFLGPIFRIVIQFVMRIQVGIFINMHLSFTNLITNQYLLPTLYCYKEHLAHHSAFTYKRTDKVLLFQLSVTGHEKLRIHSVQYMYSSTIALLLTENNTVG